MPDTLRYEFRLDPAETVRASAAIARLGWWGWGRWAAWGVPVGLVVLYRAAGVPWREMGFLAAALGLLAAAFVVAPLVQRWQLRRTYASSPRHAAPQRYEFGADGVRTSSGPAATALGWDAFTGATETPEFFLLSISRGAAYFLPKRAVGDPAEQDRLRALLRTHLGARAAALAGGAPAAAAG